MNKQKETIKKLRLLLFSECNRTCKGCCNNDWELDKLPVCEDYSKFSEIILTGGEPLLHPDIVKTVIEDIRKQTKAPIFLYTAWSGNPATILDMLEFVDGITLTLHTRKDIKPFIDLTQAVSDRSHPSKSLIAKTFRGIDVGEPDDFPGWKIKTGVRWIDNCPLPENEVFMKSKISGQFSASQKTHPSTTQHSMIGHDSTLGATT